MANLKKALRELHHVWVFDNDDLGSSYRLVAVYEAGQPVQVHKPVPRRLKAAFSQPCYSRQPELPAKEASPSLPTVLGLFQKSSPGTGL